MKRSQVFPSKYLKADDLEDRDHIVTIKTVKLEELGQGDETETKPVLYFQEMDKGVVLNQTNWNTIESLYGPESDDWAGKRITLWANHDVSFGNKIVSAIRVRSKAPTAVPVQTATNGSGDRDTLFNLVMESVAGDLNEIEPYMVSLCGQGDIEKLSNMQVRAAIQRIKGGWTPQSDKKS